MVINPISKYDDVITVDELRDQLEELQSRAEDGDLDDDEQETLVMFRELLAEVDLYNCDTLIRDTYFEQYVQELLEDCGVIPSELPHYIVIDWEATARSIQHDYTAFDFDGVTYWAR